MMLSTAPVKHTHFLPVNVLPTMQTKPDAGTLWQGRTCLPWHSLRQQAYQSATVMHGTGHTEQCNGRKQTRQLTCRSHARPPPLICLHNVLNAARFRHLPGAGTLLNAAEALPMPWGGAAGSSSGTGSGGAVLLTGMLMGTS